MHDDGRSLKDFSGTARLFPLPNLVLYPFIVQNLHIFEPRYRQMTADALTGDRLIAMVLLKPGWDAEYERKPDLYSVACLGRIDDDQRLEDGRYHLSLRGLSRVRIIREIDNVKLYRGAQVELLADRNSPSLAADRKYRDRLARGAGAWAELQEGSFPAMQQLFSGNLPVGMLCDVLSYALPLPLEVKQEVLETLDIEQRLDHLLNYLETHAPSSDPAADIPSFPPGFSVN